MRRKRHDFKSLNHRLSTAFESEQNCQRRIQLEGDQTELCEKLYWIYEGKYYDPDFMPSWSYTRLMSNTYRHNSQQSLTVEVNDFTLNLKMPVQEWRMPEHGGDIVWARDQQVVADVAGHLDGYKQLVNLIENVVPQRIEMHQVLDKAQECLRELLLRASEQEIIQIFPAIPNILGTHQSVVKRTRGVSEKRKDAILNGSWDTSVNPPVKSAPVSYVEQFQHALAFLSLKKLQPASED